jgi:hypothetical protein
VLSGLLSVSVLDPAFTIDPAPVMDPPKLVLPHVPLGLLDAWEELPTVAGPAALNERVPKHD